MNNFPFISIIIPTLNLENYIEQCLGSLQKLDYPKDKYEIILVDNNSADTTVSISRKYDVATLIMGKFTIAGSRNAGAAQAKGNIFAFIDGDCTAPSNWLRDATALFKGEGIGAVGAQYILPDDTTWVERAWFVQIDKDRNEGTTRWLPSCNMFVKRSVFKEVGGFKENITTNEDIDLCKRIKDAGYTLYSSPKISVVHLKNPKTVIEFMKKECWRGRGVWQKFLQELPRIKLNKAILFSFYTLLCLSAMIIYLFVDLRLSFMFIGLWILPSVLMSIKIVMVKGAWQYFFQLIVLYAIYGMARVMCILDARNWRRNEL